MSRMVPVGRYNCVAVTNRAGVTLLDVVRGQPLFVLRHRFDRTTYPHPQAGCLRVVERLALLVTSHCGTSVRFWDLRTRLELVHLRLRFPKIVQTVTLREISDNNGQDRAHQNSTDGVVGRRHRYTDVAAIIKVWLSSDGKRHAHIFALIGRSKTAQELLLRRLRRCRNTTHVIESPEALSRCAVNCVFWT